MITILALKLFLVAVIVCHVAAQEKNWHHKLKYENGDRRPHFNYVKGHMASDHKKRHHAQRTTSIKSNGGIKLDSYVARLYVKEQLICSGLVVSDQTVLTASSCILNVPLDDIELKLLDGTIHKVNNVTDAANYTLISGTEPQVIMLILDQKLSKEYTKPPPMCTDYVQSSEPVELWSWNKGHISLLKKTVRQIFETECKQEIDESQIINSAHSCVENNRTTEKCEKSHGLPYVWKGHFCGLNVLGHNCPKPSTADVYARLLQVKHYISRKIHEIRLSKLEDYMV